ncbi:MAG TPA: DUF1329 domain-containing protein [Gammaproteobacteria bacterium]|nr:DUF1329 domain-containing protein [Gammaproteobacteria bacterium]
MMKHEGAKLVIALMLCGGMAAATGAEVTRAEVEAWIAAEPAAWPAAGTRIAQAEIESLRELIAPGYFDYVKDPGVDFEIEATLEYRPHQVYLDATAQHGNAATLKAGGGMDGYVAGRPFDPERFDDVTPEEAGMMIAWNHVHRWQYYGYKVDALEMIYVLPGGGGAKVEGVVGGGSIDRTMVQVYHRVYLNHLAMLPAQHYKVDADGSDTRYFKEYLSFVEPFDVAGTTFVVERALDPNEEDQVNSYLPTQRRVRRLSAKERADNFMGSNFTLDDLEGYSGRVMDYEWIYRGQKQMLVVLDSREKVLRFGGPQSNVALDRWQLRPTYVVELKPRWSGHPMSAKFLFIDAQTWNPALALTIDRAGKLWRVIMPHYQMPVRDESTPERSMETSTPRWRGSFALDLKSNTTTLARATSATEFPTMSEREIERTFALSRLTEGR